MQSLFTLLTLLCWLPWVSCLWYKHANYTIPSILGITNFSYPGTDTNIESGYADGTVNSEFHQAWPRVHNGLRHVHLVRYCYADEISKNKLRCPLQAAMNKWVDALGGPPSADTGYNLFFTEKFRKEDMGFPPCYQEGTYDSQTGQGTWNWKLASNQDLLVLAYRPVDAEGKKVATASTVGYTPDEMVVPGMTKAGRHWLQISDENDVVAIAHELGHVFGLFHEHQRSDRDILLEYRPENIWGYDEAFQHATTVDKLSENDARTKLRDDYEYCTKINFRGSGYVKGAGQPGFLQGDPSAGPLDFDFDSIMIYPSDATAQDTAACHADIEKCPLLRRAGVKAQGGKKWEFVLARDKPSEKDAEWVRKTYGWEDGNE